MSTYDILRRVFRGRPVTPSWYGRKVDEAEANRFRGKPSRYMAKYVLHLEEWRERDRTAYTLARSDLERQVAEATGDEKMARERGREVDNLVARMTRERDGSILR